MWPERENFASHRASEEPGGEASLIPEFYAALALHAAPTSSPPPSKSVNTTFLVPFMPGDPWSCGSN